MTKLEKEIKILNINKEEAKQKLLQLGATLIEESTQKIYTYDLPSIYYRFCEIKDLILSHNPMIREVNKEKFINLAHEIVDLLDNELECLFYNCLGVTSLNELANVRIDTLQKLITNNKLEEIISSLMINPNKWIRLRQTNDKITLTVKHVLNKKSSNIQYVGECEIKVNDLNETNEMLNKLGIISRNYQEKRRTSFTYKSAEIEIDEWPMLDPYIEIECDCPAIISEIVDSLDYGDKEIVSLNTNELYKRQGIDILSMKVLKFN